MLESFLPTLVMSEATPNMSEEALAATPEPTASATSSNTRRIAPQECIRVLVALRPGDDGAEPCEFAAWIARTSKMQVRVRAVTTFVRPWPAVSLAKLGGKYRKWVKKEAHTSRSTVKKALHNAGIPKEQWDEEFSVFRDGPSESLLLTEEANAFHADLIILGSDAAAPKGRFLVSSTADAMLHSSPQPLGLVPRAVKLSKRGVTRVNFAFLETFEIDEPSLLLAAAWADLWEVPLRLLAFSPEGLVDSPRTDTLDLAAELGDPWREHSLAMLDRGRDIVGQHFPKLTVNTDIGTGTGWSGAVDSLKWKKGDLLYLASHPMGPLERVFIGSTATEFLRHVSVPVVVHPTAHNA